MAGLREVFAGASYFTLEDPNRLEPAERELFVRAVVGEGDDRFVLRGIVDRLDIAPNGAAARGGLQDGQGCRQGRGTEAKNLFQMKFYALVLWKLRGVVPKRLQLIFLGSGDEPSHLQPGRMGPARHRTEDHRGLEQPSAPPPSAAVAANPSQLCDWCDHKALCPAYGGTPPALPPVEVVEASEAVPGQRGQKAKAGVAAEVTSASDVETAGATDTETAGASGTEAAAAAEPVS